MLFDEDDAEELPDEAMSWSRKLVVPEACAVPDDLNIMESAWRMAANKPPVLFEDAGDDGRPVVGNPGTMAAAMGVPAAGLTVETAEQWLQQQWIAGR